MKHVCILVALVTLSACTTDFDPFASNPPPATPAGPQATDAPLSAIDPALLAPAPDQTATTAEALDTTTPDQRIAATSIDVAEEGLLGETVASLGDPTQPGFWLETPLVNTLTAGAIVNASTGGRVAVDLRPINAPQGAGSRISIAAMRALGGTLTDLIAVRVFSN